MVAAVIKKIKYTILVILGLSMLFIEDRDLTIILCIGLVISLIYCLVRNKLH